METERLVERLAADLQPVRRIPPPAQRLGWWLLVSLPATALVVLAFGLRPDLAARLSDRAFLLEEAGAFLTAVLAAYAALCAGLPDQPAWKLWLPLAPMALWLGTLGHQCLDAAIRFGLQGLVVTLDAMCVPAIALGGLVPLLAILLLLRRGGRFRATHCSICGALAAAALAAAALRLYHTQDAAIMVIVWQLGSAFLFTLLASRLTRLFLAVRPRHRLRPGM